MNSQLAVLLPCYNEELSIARVVADFRRELPEAVIYVYDNCSTDGTFMAATQAGAVVRQEPRQGKGNVVRRMFADIEADIYVIADGDGTYDASIAAEMVRRLKDNHLDMVIATRRNIFAEAHRKGHGLGNRLFNALYQSLFGKQFSDIFSGYRALSRRFVKTFPAISGGFEIETEMSVHASQLRLPVAEVAGDYSSRQAGSASKLNTFRDAFRILRTFVVLYKEIHPVRFFGGAAVLLFLVAAGLGYPLLLTYLETGLVPRFPTAILATGLGMLGGVLLTSGLILDSVARGRLEQKRLAYLALPKAGTSMAGNGQTRHESAANC